MSATTANQQWLQFRLDDPEVAGVTVHPGDGDVFSLTKQMIARSGRVGSHTRSKSSPGNSRT